MLYMKYRYTDQDGKNTDFTQLLGIYPSYEEASFIEKCLKHKLRGSERFFIEDTDKDLRPDTSYMVGKYIESLNK